MGIDLDKLFSDDEDTSVDSLFADIEEDTSVDSLFEEDESWLSKAGKIASEQVKRMPIIGSYYKAGEGIAKRFQRKPGDLTNITRQTKAYQEKQKEPDVIRTSNDPEKSGHPVKWEEEAIAFYKGENGDVLNYRNPEDRKQMEQRMESGERFYPSPDPEGYKRKRFPVKTEKAIGRVETPAIDPSFDLAFGAGFGLRKALQAGKAGAGLIAPVLKEMVSEATFGLPDIGEAVGKKIVKNVSDIDKGIYKAIDTSRLDFKAKQALLNDWQSIKDWNKTYSREGMDISNYETRKLMFKKITNQIEDVTGKMEEFDKTILKTAKDSKIDKDKFRGDIMQYLHAKHVSEYNKVYGEAAAEITDDQAAEIIKRIDESPEAEKIQKIAKEIKDYHNETLDILYANGEDYGTLTKKSYDNLKKTYPEHVPLFRVMEGETVSDSLTSGGLDVTVSAVKKGGGSQKEVKDILENIYTQRVEAIHEIEKNIVDNATYKEVDAFMKQFPDQDIFDIVTTKDKRSLYNKPSILQFKRAGKETFIKIDNPVMATALKGVGREKLNGLLKASGAVNRTIAALATKYSVGFAPANKMRDLPEMLTYMAAQKEVKNSTLSKIAAKDVVSYKGIADFLRKKDTEGSKQYKRLRELGGAGGGFSAVTKSDVAKSMKKIMKTNRSNPRKMMLGLADGIEKWNLIFEDSTRLTVFRELTKAGMNEKQAALKALNASIDFNEMGTLGPTLNSLFIFTNPSLQAAAKNIRSMKNPRVAAAAVTGIGASVWTVNAMNDKTDPDWRKKVSPYDRKNGFNIVLPTEEFNYITIPASYGLKPIKVAFENIYDIANDEDVNMAQATKDVMTSLFEGYSPMSGSSIGQTITPTPIRPFADVAANKSYKGWNIKPDWDEYAPEDVRYYPGLEKSLTGKAAIKGTKELQETTGIEISPADIQYILRQYASGAGKDIERGAKTLTSLFQGESPEVSDIPLASRFYRQTPEDYYKNEDENRIIKKEMGELSRKRFYQNKDLRELAKTDESIWSYIDEVPTEDKERIIKKISTLVTTKGIPDKTWYNKLKYIHPSVRDIVFENRYEKSPPEIQEKMFGVAARMKLLSDGFWEARARRRAKAAE